MVITKDVALPSDEELTVPQEITLSTPWFKSVAPYMARKCEMEVKDFMLRRKEVEDPRKTLQEGAAVTACGIDFLRALKKHCAPEAERLSHCVDVSSRDLYTAKCRQEQRFLDECVESNLNITRPPIGYFAKIHVHDLPASPPVRKGRDFQAEAAAVLSELPADTKLPKNYKNFSDWRTSYFES